MRVGVILAAKAPVPWLGETLESVRAQAAEVVLVDHASQPPLGAPEGVRCVRVEHAAGGPAVARQAGLEVLDTELVALADADDVWEAGKIEAQLAAFEANPNAAACFGRATVIDADGRETGERLPELAGGVHAGDDLRRELYERNPIPAASVVVRRDALVAVGGFLPPEPLPAATDWDLWLRLAAAGYEFVCEPNARIRYRRHGSGLTSSISRLAEAGLKIHERYAHLVDPELARRARATDLRALARGRVRERRYGDARDALARAAALGDLDTRDRLLKTGLAIPVLRTAFGRRNPYR